MNGNYPGGSKTRVNKAGSKIRNGTATMEDEHVIDEWRAAHRSVLNTFQAILRNRTKNENITVAQRHKRKNTIYDKLHRFEKMQLARMDDVAGCRLIFQNIADLYAFREKFHKARFKHQRRNDKVKYDYISSPKSTGYRGIHDVYAYDVNSESGKSLKGLQIEIQYRTLVQHAWATTVEIIGFITDNQPKFQKGDNKYQRAMVLASEILARAHEDTTGPMPEIKDLELVKQFSELDKEITLLDKLKKINTTEKGISQNKNTILIFHSDGELEVKTFRDAPEALKELFRLERETPQSDIVLVKADSSEDVRLAFKNYFSDANEFIKLLTTGINVLNPAH